MVFNFAPKVRDKVNIVNANDKQCLDTPANLSDIVAVVLTL